ncbi:MAG: hypothetical protein ABIC91_08135 [Nanoarchaeota archaeon]|nr:hypothetical protein [Nanoarchaeota archaeon]
MVLSEQNVNEIIEFVKKEPRTVQDVSRLIKRSWVTTNSYLEQTKEKTGLIDIKTFRKGSQAALKIVYFRSSESITSDEIRTTLFTQIMSGRKKEDFDFLEIFKFVNDDKKQAFTQILNENSSSNQGITTLFRRAKSQIYCFSGNISFINNIENNVSIIDVFEETLKRKVAIKIICRVNMASLKNLSKIQHLLEKYKGLLEIKHSNQPLRGFMIDDDFARFKSEEPTSKYREGELRKDIRIIYELLDLDWISWLQKVFWHMFRTTIDSNLMMKELNKIL